MARGRHSTIRRNEVRGIFSPEDVTAGVPLTDGMAYALLVLINAELRKRAAGVGELAITCVGTTDGALRQMRRLMTAAIDEVAVVRSIPIR